MENKQTILRREKMKIKKAKKTFQREAIRLKKLGLDRYSIRSNLWKS